MIGPMDALALRPAVRAHGRLATSYRDMTSIHLRWLARRRLNPRTTTHPQGALPLRTQPVGRNSIPTTISCAPGARATAIWRPAHRPAAARSDMPLRLPPNAGRRVPLDLLVVHSDPKDQGEGSLPAVPDGGGLVALLGLLRQPLDDLIFANGIGRAGAEHRPKLIDAQTEFVGLFCAVLGFTVLERVLAQLAEGDRLRAEVVGELHALEFFSLALQEQLLG